MSTHNLKPLSEVMKDLKSEGYREDFIFRDNKLFTSGSEAESYDASEVIIKDEYRFEGDSDPADMSILYAIETSGGKKGTLVDSYGASSDIDLEDFLGNARYEVNE